MKNICCFNIMAALMFLFSPLLFAMDGPAAVWIKGPGWKKPMEIFLIHEGKPSLIQQIAGCYHTLDGAQGKRRFNDQEMKRLFSVVDACSNPAEIKEAHEYLRQGLMYRPNSAYKCNIIDFARLWDGTPEDIIFLNALQKAVENKYLGLSQELRIAPIQASGHDLAWGIAGSADVKLVQAPKNPQERNFAVLMVDTHTGPETEDIRTNIESVVRRANAKNIQVVEVVYEPDSEQHPSSRGHVKGSKPATPPSVAQLRNDSWITVEKFAHSAFFGTGLHDDLLDKGTTDIIILGFNSNACVRETAKSATRLGYTVHTSYDILLGDFTDYWQNPEHATLAKSYLELPIFED